MVTMGESARMQAPRSLMIALAMRRCRLQTALQPSLLQLVTDLCARRLMIVRRQFALLDVAYRLFQGAGEIDAVRSLPALDFELRAAIQADADSHLLDAHHDSPFRFDQQGPSRTARTPQA